jgi:hypothetical protein
LKINNLCPVSFDILYTNILVKRYIHTALKDKSAVVIYSNVFSFTHFPNTAILPTMKQKSECGKLLTELTQHGNDELLTTSLRIFYNHILS